MAEINLLVVVEIVSMFISVVSIFISVILCYFLIGVKTEHKLSNRLFSFFLILTAIDISINLDYLSAIPLNARIFISSIFFFQLPTLYLYVLSVCFSDFNLKTKHLLHTIPFVAANLILFPRFYSVDLAAKINFLERSSSMPEIQFNHILLHVQIASYLIAIFLVLRKAKKIYLENYAGASVESLHWLFQLAFALSFFYFIALVKNVFKFTDYPYISEWLKIGLFVFELLIISWYLINALNNPGLFRNIDSKFKLVKNFISEERKAGFPSENEFHSELLKLKNYMVEKKPFLNPSLTIQNISNDIGIPTRELSLLINHNLGQHFFDFINSYRIENAKAILNDTTKNKVTILEILYEVGFNSKSSFNTAFKKHTGLTPTEYRKQLK